MDPILSRTSAPGIAAALELPVADIANPTELNAIGTAVPDWRLVRSNVSGTDQATLYRLDASTEAVAAPYIMASATAGLRWIAIAGAYMYGDGSTQISEFGANANNFSEVGVQNLSAGVSASSDFVATADTGTPSVRYIDLGINSSGYTGGVFGTALEGYLYTSDDNLNIGTAAAAKIVRILAGGSNVSTNTVATVASTGLTVAGLVDNTSASGVTSRQAATQDAMRLLGRAGGTSSFIGTLTPTTLTASRTYTFPDAAIIVSGSASALTSGRVPFVTTGGLLIDNIAFRFTTTSTQSQGNLDLAPSTVASGAACALRVVAAADTNQTLSTESSSAIFDLSATRQFATGALTTQRAFRIAAPTYSFVGASTITNAATFAISGAPIAGTNATITNAWSLWVQAGTGRFDGLLSVGDATDSTTSTTGSVTTAGGLGVAKSINAGTGFSYNGTTILSIGPASSVGVIQAGADTATASQLIANGANNTQRLFRFRTASSDRWTHAVQDNETGANAGSNYYINAYADGGTLIDTPVTIARVAGGAMTLVRPVTLSNASNGLTIAKTTGTTLTVSSTAASATVASNSIFTSGGIGATGGIYNSGGSAGHLYVSSENSNTNGFASFRQKADSIEYLWGAGGSTSTQVNKLFLFDNTNGVLAFSYTPGAITVSNWAFQGTLNATSPTSASVTFAGGIGSSKNIISSLNQCSGVTSTATAAGTTTLTNASTKVQIFTGTNTQTINFPAANVFGAGVAVEFIVINRSTGTVTPTRAGSDTFVGGGTTDPITTLNQVYYVSDGVSVWYKLAV